jgi:hypothetical protein
MVVNGVANPICAVAMYSSTTLITISPITRHQLEASFIITSAAL